MRGNCVRNLGYCDVDIFIRGGTITAAIINYCMSTDYVPSTIYYILTHSVLATTLCGSAVFFILHVRTEIQRGETNCSRSHRYYVSFTVHNFIKMSVIEVVTRRKMKAFLHSVQ